MTDPEFKEALKEYCSAVQETDFPIYPVFRGEGGTIDREKTLNAPAYLGLSDSTRAALLK